MSFVQDVVSNLLSHYIKLMMLGGADVHIWQINLL